MTEPHLSHTQSDAMLNHFLADGLEGLPGAIGLLINAAMKIERSQHLQSTDNERTEQRLGFANGFKPWESRGARGGMPAWPCPPKIMLETVNLS